MKYSEIYKIYRDSFTGTISIDDLILVQQKDKKRYYKCLCGLDCHYGIRVIDANSTVGDGFASVLHCWNSWQKWMVLPRSKVLCYQNAIGVSDIIKGEEERFFKLLEESERKIKQYMQTRKVNKLTANDLFVLHTTYGYDPSVVEEVIGNIPSVLHDEYLSLMEEHKRISKTQKDRVSE